MQQGHLKVWQISDGKPGHIKQATALLDALANFRHIEHAVLPVWPLRKVLSALIRPADADSANQGSLVLGVGHGTHLTVIALKRELSAQSAVIMNPSLPASLFDAIITPRHDGFAAGGNRIVTPLTLAPVPATSEMPDYRRGLILLGGESRHFDWQDEHVIQQMCAIAGQYPSVRWQATTSRRTPASFRATSRLPASMKMSDWAELPSDWLQQNLPRAGHIWVTEDSASMLAEAMNTRACVGLIKLATSQKQNKLRRGTSALEAERRLATVDRAYLMTDETGAAPADPACGLRENPNVACAESLLALLDL